ncbi:MAG: rhodanese-like domain-containing protein [Rhodoferax sp.]|uniref:rhodanese-like domain-containing protein n=1 Tax=Rhodoferax sp. TaxID=50421 RepID=UPI002637CE1A|nr:rhodanese-like domain-containing protein [Rhodoferax sp.]MDD2880681.1 rhodanese-like domain-containing protein [Rhodoferax sp.]
MKRMFLTLALFSALVFSALAADVKVEADEVVNDQMVSYYEQGAIGKSVWLVDSRPAGKFNSGHIPGAVNLPLDMLKNEAGSADKLGIPKSGKLVFYCAGRECTLSIDSAVMFRQMGYTDVWVYRNGVPGWNEKAQPLLAAEAFIKKGNLVLIDTAPGKDTVSVASNQVVQLALEDLKGKKGHDALALLSRNAPIVVLERGDMVAVNAVMEDLREQDFRRLAYFPASAWKGALAAAPALTKITWAPIYGPGQVAPKVFEDAVASGKFILDVRPAKDFARGHFQGAVNLPIEQMEKDFAQVPKDVPVYVNCATGAKSQKTFDILGRKGYTNVSFLDAEISCKGDKCSIKE